MLYVGEFPTTKDGHFSSEAISQTARTSQVTETGAVLIRTSVVSHDVWTWESVDLNEHDRCCDSLTGARLGS